VSDNSLGRLRYEEQTRILHGLIFDVHNSLRIGWSEEAYHQAVVTLAKERNLPIVSKPRFTLMHQNIEVHIFECDMIVWDQIILELKVLPYSTFPDSHLAQIISYLKCWGKSLGLLVNFGPLRAQTKRVIWDEPPLTTIVNFEALFLNSPIEQETTHLIQ